MRSGDLLFRPGSLPRLSVLWPISDGGPWAREGRSLAHVGRPGPLGLRGEREGSRVPSGLGRSGLVRSGLDRSEPVRVWRALNGPVGPRAGRGPQQSIPFLALGWPIPLLWALCPQSAWKASASAANVLLSTELRCRGRWPCGHGCDLGSGPRQKSKWNSASRPKGEPRWWDTARMLGATRRSGYPSDSSRRRRSQRVVGLTATSTRRPAALIGPGPGAALPSRPDGASAGDCPPPPPARAGERHCPPARTVQAAGLGPGPPSASTATRRPHRPGPGATLSSRPDGARLR